MRRPVIFVLILCFYACNYFEKQKISSDDIITEELNAINWNDVDEYPTFEQCRDAGVTERRACFEQELSKHVLIALSKHPRVVTSPINDTIYVTFKVLGTGEIEVLEISMDNDLVQQLPGIDTLIRASITNLPKIEPAIKRGQFVTTEFSLPILVQAQ